MCYTKQQQTLTQKWYITILPFSVISLYREVGQQKRVLMSGPSWRSVPKSKSSGAILQELPSPSWIGGTNTGVYLSVYFHASAATFIRFDWFLHLACVCESALGRSELDELQEEVARRARQQEQLKRREAEREVAMGFNPKPSKYMDLDQLQHQGMEGKGLKSKQGGAVREGERQRFNIIEQHC